MGSHMVSVLSSNSVASCCASVSPWQLVPTGGILVALALLARSTWHSGGGLRASERGNHPPSGRGGGKYRRRASKECDSNKHRDQEFSFEHMNELHTNLFFTICRLENGCTRRRSCLREE